MGSGVYDGDMAKEQSVKADAQKKTPLPTVLKTSDEARKHRAFKRLQDLKGKIHLDIDIDELRGRNR